MKKDIKMQIIGAVVTLICINTTAHGACSSSSFSSSILSRLDTSSKENNSSKKRKNPPSPTNNELPHIRKCREIRETAKSASSDELRLLQTPTLLEETLPSIINVKEVISLNY